MKRFAAALLGAFFSPFFLFSLTIDDVCTSLSSHSVTAGDFVQEKSLANTNRKLKSSGIFVFCDKGVVWHTKKPVSSIMVVEENRIVQKMPDGTKSVIDGSQNAVFKTSAETISSVFKGDRASLESYFTVVFSSERGEWKMELTPKDSAMKAAMKKIILSGSFTDAASFDVLEIIQGNSLSTVYAFSNQSYAKEMTREQQLYFE